MKLTITLKNTKYRERTGQRGADGDVIPVPQSLQLPKRALLKARNAPWLWVLLFQETVPGRSLLWVLWGAPVPLQEEAGRGISNQAPQLAKQQPQEMPTASGSALPFAAALSQGHPEETTAALAQPHSCPSRSRSALRWACRKETDWQTKPLNTALRVVIQSTRCRTLC